MNFSLYGHTRTIRIISMITVGFTACWGFFLVLAQVKPFWTDEWRLIYNLKFKNPAALWGPLDYTQQFPRLYLEVVKAFTSLFSYSYFTMRLPSFLMGMLSIVLCYRLMNRIYGRSTSSRFLFLFILLSSYTFTEYFVQVKQYTMEIFMCLVALWQLLQLISIPGHGVPGKGSYAWLCFTFLAAPFFSYTYPIAIAPVFAVVLLQSILAPSGRKRLLLQWLPLFISAVSVFIFYKVDVSRVMGDGDMNGYWRYRMIGGCSNIANVFVRIWDLFTQPGSGLFFEVVFGTLGVSAFFYAIARSVTSVRRRAADADALLHIYALLVVVLAIALFLLGKLPIEPKFNAFATPSLAILIIAMLQRSYASAGYRAHGLRVSALIFAGLTGNIFSSAARLVLSPTYAKRVDIYVATENAIMKAQADKVPILVTPGVAFPDAITDKVPNLAPISACTVLKTFPAYKVDEDLPVMCVNTLAEVRAYIRMLPSTIRMVMVGDGVNYTLVRTEELR